MEGFRYEDLFADSIQAEVFLLNMRDKVVLAIEKHKADSNLRTSPRPGSMASRATRRLRVWTQFVGRLDFRINLVSLHADLSLPTVIYRDKALPCQGRFIISAWASEAAENVDSSGGRAAENTARH